MTGRNFISEAWEKEERSFFNNLSTIRHQPSRDAVHDLRVSVKKMRAYLLLNQELSGLSFKESFKHLKRFFAVAGRYRDTQMSLALAKKQEERHDVFYPAFEDHLRACLPLAEQWTKQAAIEFDLHGISRLRIILMEGMKDGGDSDLKASLGRAAEKKLQEVKRLSGEFEKNAHEIRKLLKILYYWLLLYPVLGEEEMKTLNELLDTLGKWQDHIVLKATVRRFRKDWLVKGTRLHEHAAHFENFIGDEANDLLKKAFIEMNRIREHIPA